MAQVGAPLEEIREAARNLKVGLLSNATVWLEEAGDDLAGVVRAEGRRQKEEGRRKKAEATTGTSCGTVRRTHDRTTNGLPTPRARRRRVPR